MPPGRPRPSLLFIIPANDRVPLASICYRQHAALITTLKARGIDASALVIADDGNLDAAHAAGLLTLERPNELGAKLNAGYTYAARHGYTFVCPLGSDNWVDPGYITQLADLPDRQTMLCTRSFTVIRKDGQEQARLRIGYDGGVGIRVIPTGMLRRCNYKPLEPDRGRACDASTLDRIRRSFGQVRFQYSNQHPLEVVGFQSDVQITSYELLLRRWLIERANSPLAGLAEHYPPNLIRQIRGFYSTPSRAAA